MADFLPGEGKKSREYFVYFKGSADQIGKSDLREILRQKKARERGNTLRISSSSNAFLAQKIRKAPKTHLIRGSQNFLTKPDGKYAAKTYVTIYSEVPKEKSGAKRL